MTIGRRSLALCRRVPLMMGTFIEPDGELEKAKKAFLGDSLTGG